MTGVATETASFRIGRGTGLGAALLVLLAVPGGCQTMAEPVPEPVWLSSSGAAGGPAAEKAAAACLASTQALAAAGGPGLQVTGQLRNAGLDYLAGLRQDTLIVAMRDCMAGKGFHLQGVPSSRTRAV